MKFVPHFATPILVSCLISGCVAPPCPPPETIVVHDTVQVPLKSPEEKDLVGYFDPSDKIVYAKEGHEKKVLELLDARLVREGFYKVLVHYTSGETSSMGVSLKLVNSPADFVRMIPNSGRKPVPGIIYANAECSPFTKERKTPCKPFRDSTQFHMIQIRNSGLCVEGKGYCYALDTMVTSIIEVYQDSECTVMLDALPRDAFNRCIPK